MIYDKIILPPVNDSEVLYLTVNM